MDRQSLAESKSAAVVAVILGASEFPAAGGLSASPAFAGSASAFMRYLKSERGFHLPKSRVLNLFDSDATVIEQNDRLTEHLQRHPDASDLIIYYVGHGGFLPDREYFLALHSTKRGAEGITGLRIRALAQSLEEHFPGKRVFLILDCCFAGEAVSQFQSGELATIVENKTFDALPETGTSLLVAASKDEPAIAPIGAAYTMFSDCLLEVLEQGIADARETLSLSDVGESVQGLVRRKFGQRAVRPEIHSPRQGKGDVAKMPLFPNPSYTPPEPRVLPAAIQDALRNPIADIRQGAIRSLAQFLNGADAELGKLARGELEQLASADDSLSVRERAQEALGKPEDDVEPPIEDIPKSNRAQLAIAVGLVVALLGAGLFWGFSTRVPVPNPTDAKIEKLLTDAERDVAEERLDSPKGNNALERYREVLRLDSDNHAAQEGLDRIVGQLVTRADGAIGEEELDKAEEYVAKARAIAPADAQVVEVGARLDEARTSIQRRNKIRLLLVDADKKLQQNRLVNPAGNDAVEDYRAVLALEPNNRAALDGLDRVVDRYVALADDALDAGKHDKARSYLAQAKAIAPRNVQLAGLRDRIEAGPVSTTRAAAPKRAHEIQQLLAKADIDLQNNRLTTPSGNNAVEGYRAVLAIDPANQAARIGLDRVVAQYIAFTNAAITAKNFDKAQIYLEKAKGIAPENLELAALRARIEEGEAARQDYETVERLLSAAKRRFLQGSLDAPVGDNAVESYLAVLARDPGNQAAKSGLDRVAGRFLELGYRSIDEGALDKAGDYLAKAEGVAPDHPDLADFRIRLKAVADSPSELTFAVFPFQSLAICHFSVREEVTDAADAIVREQPRAKIAYSYYAANADASKIPGMHELWSDNHARREPKLDTVRKAGRDLGVNGVLMIWYKCSQSQHVAADNYEVEAYLIDVNRDEVFHVKKGFLDTDRAVSDVFGRFFAAYNIDPA